MPVAEASSGNHHHPQPLAPHLLSTPVCCSNKGLHARQPRPTSKRDRLTSSNFIDFQGPQEVGKILLRILRLVLLRRFWLLLQGWGREGILGRISPNWGILQVVLNCLRLGIRRGMIHGGRGILVRLLRIHVRCRFRGLRKELLLLQRHLLLESGLGLPRLVELGCWGLVDLGLGGAIVTIGPNTVKLQAYAS